MTRKELTKAIAYFRTSSATNVGEDKDTLKRQRAAVEAFGFGCMMRLPSVRRSRPL